jgi:hypothetical protein
VIAVIFSFFPIFPMLSSLTATSSKPEAFRATVMIVGTHHFDPSGEDVFNLEVDDVFSERRQREIKILVDRLAAFAPTKIALELDPEFQEDFNTDFQAYTVGDYQLTRNERDQIGMRLAKKLGHQQLFAVDAAVALDTGGLQAAAEAGGEVALFERVMSEDAPALLAEIQAVENDPDSTILDLFRVINGDWHVRNHQIYGQLATLGTAENPEGARFASQWNLRNLIIAANVEDLIESEDERILVLFGAGHRLLIERALRDMAELRVVDPAEYLGRPSTTAD